VNHQNPQTEQAYANETLHGQVAKVFESGKKKRAQGHAFQGEEVNQR
jgi:hypothetical protein